MTRLTLLSSLFTLLSPASAQSLVTLYKGDMELTVTGYGARIVSLKAFDTDVVLGYDNPADYRSTKQNFGAVVGRYIGRIIGGHLAIDGQEYQLDRQGSGDCGHGGDPNFGGRDWEFSSLKLDHVTLRYVSPDGEHGFPGELTMDVTYTLLPDALRIDYQATTSKPTVLNPSNHSFFNLTGDLGSAILDEELWVNGDSIALYDQNKRVTGQLGAVAGTPFDFRTPHLIGDSIDAENFQLSVTKGYDHCYRLNDVNPSTPDGSADSLLDLLPGLHYAASLHDRGTGLTMQVFTTEPAMQIYTANGHKGNLIGKGGKPYIRRNAICFETMHFPDSPNKPQWPSTLLRPGEVFRSTTIYRFSK